MRSGRSTRWRRRFDSGDCAASLLDNLAVIPLLHGHYHGLGGFRGGCATLARRKAYGAAVRSRISRGEKRGACTDRQCDGDCEMVQALAEKRVNVGAYGCE